MEVNSIAHELITRGWTKGAVVGEDGRVCLVGAAAAAHGCIQPESDGFVWTFYAWATVPRSAQLAVLSAIGAPDGNCDDVWKFNDSHDRDEVLRVAKHADELLSES